MFKNKLNYYHGTSQKVWEKIQEEKRFVPSPKKNVGDFWITKGIYFVCENPYIALWYAHLSSVKDESPPIVICFEYEITEEEKERHLNLLTSDGHRLLATIHTLYKERFDRENEQGKLAESINLDSVVLQLLFDNSSILKTISAAFQEGKSYQNMIYPHPYSNKKVADQKGISPGDHVEICFYPTFNIHDEMELRILQKEDILNELDDTCDFWSLVCVGLTDSFQENQFTADFMQALLN